MMCELCGRDAPFLKEVIIEGSRLMVCPGCAKMGTRYIEEKQRDIPKALIEERLRRRTLKARPKDIYQEIGESLVEDYSARIMKARQKKCLTREEMGRMINEKAGVIGRLENGSLRPDDALRKKIERFLGVSLLTKATKGILTHRTRARGMTLGDLIKIEKDKGK